MFDIHRGSKKTRNQTFLYIFAKYWRIFKKCFHWHTLWTIFNKLLLYITPNLNCVAAATFWNINVRKTNNSCSNCARRLIGHFRKFRPRSRWMISTTPDHAVTLDICHVERCVWLVFLAYSQFIKSGHVLFSGLRAYFGLPLPCLLSVLLLLPVSRIFSVNCLSPLLFQYISGNSLNSLRETVSFELV